MLFWSSWWYPNPKINDESDNDIMIGHSLGSNVILVELIVLELRLYIYILLSSIKLFLSIILILQPPKNYKNSLISFDELDNIWLFSVSVSFSLLKLILSSSILSF